MSEDITALVKASLSRELESLRDAVRDLAAPLDERQFWTKPLDPGNSFGHLVLHLAGNLKWFVGAQVGGSGYVRDREARIHRTESAGQGRRAGRARRGRGDLPSRGAGAERRAAGRAHPTERFGNVFNALISVTSHFALHRGQMSYISPPGPGRRTVSGRAGRPGTVRPDGACKFTYLDILACGRFAS